MLTAVLLATVLAQSALIAYFFKATTAERATLLQRIQAPEAAVIEHARAGLPPDPLPLPYDDDEAFHDSRDELAARLASFESKPL